MALKKIFWTQIETENIPIGEQINIGSPSSYINDIYTTDLWINGVNIDDYFTDSNIWFQTGSFYATTNDLQVTGSMTIKGDLTVEGKTTLAHDTVGEDSLIVSGVMKVVRSEIQSQITSASLSVGDFTIKEDSSLGNNEILDLGEF